MLVGSVDNKGDVWFEKPLEYMKWRPYIKRPFIIFCGGNDSYGFFRVGVLWSVTTALSFCKRINRHFNCDHSYTRFIFQNFIRMAFSFEKYSQARLWSQWWFVWAWIFKNHRLLLNQAVGIPHQFSPTFYSVWQRELIFSSNQKVNPISNRHFLVNFTISSRIHQFSWT